MQLAFHTECDRFPISNGHGRAHIIVSPTDSMHEKSNRAVAAKQLRRNWLSKGLSTGHLQKSRLLAALAAYARPSGLSGRTDMARVGAWAAAFKSVPAKSIEFKLLAPSYR